VSQIFVSKKQAKQTLFCGVASFVLSTPERLVGRSFRLSRTICHNSRRQVDVFDVLTIDPERIHRHVEIFALLNAAVDGANVGKNFFDGFSLFRGPVKITVA
jgi:hypothetical protein